MIISLAELFRGLGHLVIKYRAAIIHESDAHVTATCQLFFRAPIICYFFYKEGFCKQGASVNMNVQELEISQHTEQFAIG